MSSSYLPTPTTKDLSILEPEFRDFIGNFPDTTETAETGDVVVNFMRSIPPRPHDDPRVIKQDIQVSSPNAPSTQPPVNVRVYSPKDVDPARPLPVLLWMVRVLPPGSTQSAALSVRDHSTTVDFSPQDHSAWTPSAARSRPRRTSS